MKKFPVHSYGRFETTTLFGRGFWRSKRRLIVSLIVSEFCLKPRLRRLIHSHLWHSTVSPIHRNLLSLSSLTIYRHYCISLASCLHNNSLSLSSLTIYRHSWSIFLKHSIVSLMTFYCLSHPWQSILASCLNENSLSLSSITIYRHSRLEGTLPSSNSFRMMIETDVSTPKWLVFSTHFCFLRRDNRITMPKF